MLATKLKVTDVPVWPVGLTAVPHKQLLTVTEDSSAVGKATLVMLLYTHRRPYRSAVRVVKMASHGCLMPESQN